MTFWCWPNDQEEPADAKHRRMRIRRPASRCSTWCMNARIKSNPRPEERSRPSGDLGSGIDPGSNPSPESATSKMRSSPIRENSIEIGRSGSPPCPCRWALVTASSKASRMAKTNSGLRPSTTSPRRTKSRVDWTTSGNEPVKDRTSCWSVMPGKDQSPQNGRLRRQTLAASRQCQKLRQWPD